MPHSGPIVAAVVQTAARNTSSSSVSITARSTNGHAAVAATKPGQDASRKRWLFARDQVRRLVTSQTNARRAAPAPVEPHVADALVAARREHVEHTGTPGETGLCLVHLLQDVEVEVRSRPVVLERIRRERPAITVALQVRGDHRGEVLDVVEQRADRRRPVLVGERARPRAPRCVGVRELIVAPPLQVARVGHVAHRRDRPALQQMDLATAAGPLHVLRQVVEDAAAHAHLVDLAQHAVGQRWRTGRAASVEHPAAAGVQADLLRVDESADESLARSLDRADHRDGQRRAHGIGGEHHAGPLRGHHVLDHDRHPASFGGGLPPRRGSRRRSRRRTSASRCGRRR